MPAKYCKPNVKGRCRYCGGGNRTGQDRCNSESPRKASPGKDATRPERRKKPKAVRTDDQRLAIIDTHCRSCENFRDAPTLENMKCRKVGSCGCLWSKLRSALFACPLGKFGRDESLIDQFNNH